MRRLGLVTSIVLLSGIIGTTTVAGIQSFDTAFHNEASVALNDPDSNDNVIKTVNSIGQFAVSDNVEQTKALVVDTQKKNAKKKKKKVKKEYIGNFKVTGYCACTYCTGSGSGRTASGTIATAGRTIAADTSKYPFGTKMVIDGHTYTVEDRGGAINGNKIDIFFSSHSQALQWGVRYCDVYITK